jgi:acyl-CoA thioesterase
MAPGYRNVDTLRFVVRLASIVDDETNRIDVGSRGATMKFAFDAATAVTHEDGARWTARLDPGWTTIGGAPNGGYLLAVALAAAEQVVGGQRLLTATAHYLRAGAVGPAELEVEPVKRGRLTSTVGVALRQDGTERVRVLATYGDPEALDGPAELSIAAPPIPDPAECLAPSAELALRLDAHLALRFDYRVPAISRWVGGDGPGRARIDGWIRFADGRDPDLAALPLMADAFPPALGELVGPTHAPTLELTIHPRQTPSPGWIQVGIESRQLAGGLVEEDAYLWDSKGGLVAMSRQLCLRR